MKRSLPLLASVVLAVLSPLASADQAADTTITFTNQAPGVTPFIAKLTFTASDLTPIRNIQFTVAPKPGSVTRALSATYTKAYLVDRGYVDSGARQITVPVFGLYDGYANSVTVNYSFGDGSSSSSVVPVQTAAFSDPPFNTPTVVQARTNTTQLSYDYMLVASSNSTHSPTIIDTDGALRWVGTDGVQNHYTAFFRNGIYHFQGPQLIRMELDGAWKVVADYSSQSVIGFSHNIDPGKYGMILDANTKYYTDCVHFEVDRAGRILKKWNLADIVRDAMVAGGDDPTNFVRPANGDTGFGSSADWAHDNAVTYRKSDDSIIISSRENFVICIDYDTSAIKWILGDTTKAWYQYPSLRKFALLPTNGTITPAGQHSVSITHDDRLLLFDNGQPSANHSPVGVRRPYSAGRKYSLDLNAKTATEVWTFDNNKTVRSGFRSSIYEDAPDNYLVDYAVAENGNGSIRAEILGLLPSGEKVFDYIYPTQAGFVAYRSIPIHLENLSFPFKTRVQLANISARSPVEGGDNVAIAGFTIAGPLAKDVVIRGLGPSLQANGSPVPGRLMDPQLTLYGSGGQELQTNDNYSNGANAAAIDQSGLAPTNEREAAMLVNLQPGAYTAVLRGVNDTTGVGLVEVYDLAPDNTSALVNLSTRAFNSSGDNVLIGGLIVQGDYPGRFLVRVLGPELKAQGVSNAFDDTTLDIFNADGVKLASNDDWRQAPNASDVEGTGIAPTDDRESAILTDANAGSYTCIARGKAESGVVLLETYQLDQP